MQAVVLVGGFGTRLRPLTNTIPKQLLEVAGVPMIERVLAALGRHGVTQAVLSMGYLPDPFLAAYPDRRVAGVDVLFAVEPEPLDTAGAIRFAASAAGIDATFLAVNGDVLTDLDVGVLVRRHRSTGAEGTVHLTPVEDPSRFGVVVTDPDGRVTAWVEKPEGAAPSNQINAGTYVLEPTVLDRIPEGTPVSIERVVFPELLAEGRLYGWLDACYWLDAGTPAAFLAANLDVLDGRRGCETPGTRAQGCLVLPGAEIEAGATAVHSVLGRGARVAAGARVENSVLLDRAELREGASVVDSIVGPAATIGEDASLSGRCVVAADARVERGAVLEGAGFG